MPRNTAVQRFRETATKDDWKKAVADHEKMSDEDFRKEYGFAWNSILSDAADKGFYERKRNRSTTTPLQSNTSEPKTFIVSDSPAGRKKIARSVQIYEDIAERLKALENDKGQYTHASILNQLLDEALTSYGY